jgi:hypothetical protein
MRRTWGTLASGPGAACMGAALAASVAAGCGALLGIDDLPGDAGDAAPDHTSDAPDDATGRMDGGMGGGTDGGMDAPMDGEAEAGDAGNSGDAASEGSPVVSLDGCVLLLHMDEPSWSGPGSVKDSSGQGNDGTPMGSAEPTPNGKFGRAALFDGNGWVDVPCSASLDGPMTQLTYSAWVYPTGLTDGTASPGIISKRQGYAEEVAFTLFLWTNNAAWVDLQAFRSNTNAVFSNNAWYHLVVVYDGSQATAGAGETIYVNGVVDSVHPADPVLATNMQDVLIGNLPGGGNLFVGMIDEVALWTRALSAAEIQSLYLADGGL